MIERDGGLRIPFRKAAINVRGAAGGVPHEAWRTEPPSVPLVARRLADEASASAAHSPSRRECDALQAALAGWGTAAGDPAPDWAGYVVG